MNLSNSGKKQNKPAGKRKFHWFRFFTIILAICVGIEVVLGTVAIVAVSSMLADEPKVNLDNFYSTETTLVYDKDGNQIADVGAQIRENITYDEVPEALIDAFLSIEDSRYFVHNGFDIPRFTASIINTLTKDDVQGGSTFTMQLVKMTYFVDDTTGTSSTKNVEYKVQQIDLAMQLEKKSTKKQIFEMYLNKMNFGGIGNIRGVEKASEQYFGKRVSQLNLTECALLAGVVNSPYFYNPYTYLDHATVRRNEVLDQMYYHGYITEDQFDLAESVKVEDLLVAPKSQSTTNQYQAYIDYAIKEAEEVSGQDPLNVSMEIYTAMDPNVQTTMEEIEAGNTDIPFQNDLQEMGVICENNQNGEVVGIGGGRNYVNNGSMLLNHATDQLKQPGSSVKPFLDYAPTFDYLGWATSHVIIDQPVTYGGWTYRNASGQYYGPVTLQRALSWSLNTPAIQACQAVIDKQGAQWYIDYLKKLGFNSDVAENFDIAYAIGGNNFVCTPEQLAGAHSTIMNKGNYITPHTVRKIVFRSGTQTPIEPKYEATSVMSPQAAYMIAQLMYGNIHGGDINLLQNLIRDYQTFGKTGTTDWGDSGREYGIPDGAEKDKWTVADTTQYTIACWVGWEKAIAGQDTYFASSWLMVNINGRICAAVMDAATASTGTPADLAKPDGLTEIKHITGVFPYVAPTDNIPAKYISTGIIKTEFSKLGTYSSTVSPLSNLASFTAKLNTDGTLTFGWTPYPDSSKLTIASGNNISFDPSWISGPVVYKVRLTQKGATVAELKSSSESSTQTATLAYNTETKACGYYGYENTSDESNEVCVTFTTGDDPAAPTTKTGTVKQLIGTTLYLTDNSQIPLAGVAITKGGATVDASAFKQGDNLTITYVKGSVTAIAIS